MPFEVSFVYAFSAMINYWSTLRRKLDISTQPKHLKIIALQCNVRKKYFFAKLIKNSKKKTKK